MLAIALFEIELNKLVYPQDLNIVDKIMDKKETFPQSIHKVDNFPKILFKNEKILPPIRKAAQFCFLFHVKHTHRMCVLA